MPEQTQRDLKPPADGFVSRYPDSHFDALLLVSFGGPEGPDDVIPFLENVTRGRNIPPERLAEVGRHYDLFGGVSPLNGQNRALISALREELDRHEIDLPIYFGNRNWHPMLADTLAEMADAGIERALAFFTSAYSSYSGCRQYRENLFEAQEAVGPRAPEVLRLRSFYNHPGFVEANAARVRSALEKVPSGRRGRAHLAFTAHSIPVTMSKASRYEQQLRETSRLVAEAVGVVDTAVVYQSRSGPPHVPWLEPDVVDHLSALADRGVDGRRGGPDRVRLRSRRGPLRPGRRGGAGRSRPWRQPRARVDRGHASCFRRDDPRARCRSASTPQSHGARSGPSGPPTTSARPTAAGPARSGRPRGRRPPRDVARAG